MKRKNFNKPVQFKRQTLNMLEGTTDYCLDPANILITDLIPDFKQNVLAVDKDVKDIQKLRGPRLFITFGQQKNFLRKGLSENLFSVTNPVAAYAFSKQNFDLESQMSKSISEYMKLKPAALISFAQTVITIVTQMLPSIVNTGVNQTALEAIAQARTAFIPYANKPVDNKDDDKTDTQEIIRLLTDAMNITYGEMDRYAVQFKKLGKINFLNGYKNRRKLKNYGVKHAHASVDVLIGDAIPVKGAKVQVEGSDLFGFTDAKGHVSVSKVSPGMHGLIITSSEFPQPIHVPAKEFIKGKPTYFTVNVNLFDVPAPQETTQNQNA
ncbi:MAG: hypothetical protein ABI855_08090 [Bacteroidota bacterium]